LPNLRTKKTSQGKERKRKGRINKDDYRIRSSRKKKEIFANALKKEEKKKKIKGRNLPAE